ncbi:MAG: EamA family transporter [Acidobacteriaceae bacterium]|nr:EamA family transporter [Acidobacteriaceae bacterium]MBV8570051.1 EamA family transporter [Acidobacteriaceae bacterium]
MPVHADLAAGLVGEPGSPLCERAARLKTLVLVLVVVSLNSFGDLALAWGMRHSSTVRTNPLEYLAAMANPFVELGIVLLVLWMLTRMALLSWADLSFVLPVTGTAYVMAAVLGKMFLHETISAVHWSGIFLIFAGTALVGSTKFKTQESC